MIWRIWSFILRRLAKAQGFLDPVSVFSSLQRFSQPTEVWVPTELLRSGAVLQARGLINSQAIQHNLDWVWPYWVERQFSPNDPAFIPRAFSVTHINLTHRNWTAVGVPDVSDMPIVDPRGLVTPFFDGWSLDAWVVAEDLSFNLIPSRLLAADQAVYFDDILKVVTTSKIKDFRLESSAFVEIEDEHSVCKTLFKAVAPARSWLIVCVRPYNPEGISFIRHAERLENQEGWHINNKEKIFLSEAPRQYVFSNYHLGDIYNQITTLKSSAYSPNAKNSKNISCDVGMASAAAIYELKPNEPKEISLKVPLAKLKTTISSWSDHLEGHCKLQVPDEKFQFLYDVALRMLILHSPEDVYPGPFTYKRFWFRDAAYILHSMIAVGLLKNIEKIIDRFSTRQKPSGYFMSQDGEWDSNGQAIWAIERYSTLANKTIKEQWLHNVYQGARWIQWRRSSGKDNVIHAGLLPAGFSAEHFGPSNFYYWDDFWSVAGLKSAAHLAERHADVSHRFSDEATDLMHSIEKSLRAAQVQHSHFGIPASPYRRMDAGAVGSLVVSYPLQLWPASDKRVQETVDFLLNKHFIEGCFYHEISHSGINVYLTLHAAQVLLRAGDPRFFDIVEAVAKMASPTGQWPEAIHPKTKGGCMGDGQHIWAAAEWVFMLRNMFVREETETRTLVLCSGIPASWLRPHETLSFGPTLTSFGKVSVYIKVEETIEITWEAEWYREAPNLEVHLQGYPKQTLKKEQNKIKIKIDPAALIIF